MGSEEHIFRSKYGSVCVPEDVSLPEFVLQDAELYADKVALVESVTGKEYRYGQVVRDTRRFSKALLSIGIRKGHVVLVVLPNVAEYPMVALGIMGAGAVFSGANPASHPLEIRKQVEAADAKLVVTSGAAYSKVRDLGLPVIVVGEEQVPTAMNWEALLEASDKASERSPAAVVSQTDLCALPFSSGTTGVSKGVMLSHRNLVASLSSSLYGVERDMVGKVTTLGLMPFFHIYGITGICCATLRNKGKVVVLPRFDLRTFIAALITHEVTFAPLVPPILLQLVKSPVVDEFDLSRLSLQAVMTAAAPLAPELLNAFEAKFPGVQVQEAYGLTEHSCITLTHSSRRGPPAKRNSVGHILPNIELKFLDPYSSRSLPANTPGELCVRSQCVMKGYYNNQLETDHTIDPQGWLHTGDIGYIDDDGNVFVVDRIKELIKYKGFQVAPAELEAVLLANPLIADVAVIPLPDEEAGEIPAACVVMSDGARETTTEDDIMEFVSLHVASYKRVREVHFMDSIPKSASGKIMRRLLKDTVINNKKNNHTNILKSS